MMKRKIGENFLYNFKDRLDKDYKSRTESFKACYSDRTNYTKYISTVIKDITEGLAKSNDSDCNEDYIEKNKLYSEYYRIDYTVWSIKEKTAKNGKHIYHWNFDIAIEHENDHKDWTYELLKLSFIRADARIVIGYTDSGARNEEEYVIKEQVEEFKYDDADCKKDLEFYVVLMNRVLSDDNPFDMRIYKIEGRGVRQLDNL